MKSKNFAALLVIGGVSLAGVALAKDDCARLRPQQIAKASDACISDWQAKLQEALDQRYEKIASRLPATGSPSTADEFEGISKQSAQQAYADWKKQAESYCVLAAGRYGLTRKHESRERSICWVQEAQRHLNAIKGF
ncbi:hypothetical protein [Hydrogenophaga sp.]|uniref:hypothetical protein n=1 Tax=Hydrogenophaga sp. TaxID=1904254 RepID=UPI0035ADC21E